MSLRFFRVSCYFVLMVFVYFVVNYFLLDVTPKDLLSVFSHQIQHSYYPNHNTFVDAKFRGIHLHVFFYLMIVFLCLGAAFFRFALGTHRVAGFRGSGKIYLTIIAFMYVLLAGLQSASQFSYFGNLIRTFQGKSLAERREHVFRLESYRYVEFVKKHFSARTLYLVPAKIISDSHVEYSIDPYIISYFLYPEFDFFSDVDRVDFLLLFNRTDPHLSVPDHFKIVAQFNPKSLLAVRKD